MELSDKQKAKLADGREYRSMPLMSNSPAANDTECIVTGYATTYNQPYVLYEDESYRLLEQVAPGAFDDCDMTDTLFQFNHAGRVYARTKNNTLDLISDEHGLKVTANLGGTDIGRQLYQEIQGGYIDKMSFGFRVLEDTRETTTDHETGVVTCLRTITKIKKLYDVSAVDQPANDMTSISARSLLDGEIERAEAERLDRERIRIKLYMEATK